MAQELKERGKVQYDVEVFPFEEAHCIFQFRTEKDKEAAMVNGPWLIADQLLRMERWMPNFQPGSSPINTMVVWLRLPNLSMEYRDRVNLEYCGSS